MNDHTPVRATDERLAEIAALLNEPASTTEYADRMPALVAAMPELLDTVIVLQSVLDMVREIVDKAPVDDASLDLIASVSAALDVAK